MLIDMVVVPLGIALIFLYHGYLWRKCKCQGILVLEVNKKARKKWVEHYMEDNGTNDHKNNTAAHTARNGIMYATLLATLSIMLMAGAGAIFSTSKQSNETSTATHVEVSPLALSMGFDLGYEEVLLTIKFASTVGFLALSFLLSSQSLRFLGAFNVMINVPPHAPLLISAAYVTKLYDVSCLLFMLASRALYVGCCLFLWIMGPLPVFASCIGLIAVFYRLDFAYPSYPSKGSDSTGLAESFSLI